MFRTFSKLLAVLALLLPISLAHAQPVPDRDLLVELGDAQANGDLDAARRIAVEILIISPIDDPATRLDVADFLAEAGEPLSALPEYERQADALAAQDPVDTARLIDMKARMADLAATAGDPARATRYIGEAVGLVYVHLGDDHPRLAPLLAFARDQELDFAEIAEIAGIAGGAEALEQLFEFSIARAEASSAPLATRRTVGPRTIQREPDFDLVTVYYGTNRAHEKRSSFFFGDREVLDARTHYGSRRAPLETGTVVVSVPHNRSIGEIPKPSVLRFDFRPDPAKHVILGDMTVHKDLAEFTTRMKQEIARSGRKEVFVYVHGYNNDFPTAVERTAQLAVDLEIDGVPVLYSWPSEGSVFGYRSDRKQITDETLSDLDTFLTVIAEKTGAEHVHVVAHSMGNEFLLGALQKMAARAHETPPFEQLVFASPDVDADEFEAKVPAILSLAEEVTLYASAKDLALQASKRFNASGRRAGDANEPVVLAGLSTIDTTPGSTGMLGHSDIFGAAFPDFQAILWLSLEPDQRCLLGRRDANQTTWVFGEPNDTFCGREEFTTAITALRRVGPGEVLPMLQSQANKAEQLNPAAGLVWRSALRIVEPLL